MGLVNSEFLFLNKKADYYFEKSVDCFIKSWKFKYGSLDWSIYRLLMQKYEQLGFKYFHKANKIYERGGF